MSDFINRVVSSARAAVSISEREEIKSALFEFPSAVSDVECDCESAIVCLSLTSNMDKPFGSVLIPPIAN